MISSAGSLCSCQVTGAWSPASEAYEGAARELNQTNQCSRDAGATYPSEAVLTRKQLADALHCTQSTIKRSSLLVSYALGKRSPRYVAASC